MMKDIRRILILGFVVLLGCTGKTKLIRDITNRPIVLSPYRGSVKKVVINDGKEEHILEYNEKGCRTIGENVLYDENDNLIKCMLGENTHQYSYNEKGDVITWYASDSYGNEYLRVSYEYDKFGNTIRETTVDESEGLDHIELEYDTNGGYIKRKKKLKGFIVRMVSS